MISAGRSTAHAEERTSCSRCTPTSVQPPLARAKGEPWLLAGERIAWGTFRGDAEVVGYTHADAHISAYRHTRDRSTGKKTPIALMTASPAASRTR